MSEIVKEFGKDFHSDGGALTLDTDEVRQSPHADGWAITGQIHDDYYEWVNDFEAVHPTLGKVWGNFEDKVYATSEEAYQHFYKHHEPHAWDYGDI